MKTKSQIIQATDSLGLGVEINAPADHYGRRYEFTTDGRTLCLCLGAQRQMRGR